MLFRSTLRPFGSLSQYARRAAAEAEDADGSAEAAVAAAADLSAALTAPAYTAGELGASKLTLDQYLLLRVGPFPDVWEVRLPLRDRASRSAHPTPTRSLITRPILRTRLRARRSAWR